MAKLTYAPIVSDVRGRFGGTVFTSWQGVAAMRRFVPPSQPRTTQQVAHRNLFRNLTALYLRGANTRFRDSWARRAQGQPGIGRNFYMGTNLFQLAGKGDLEDMQPYYGLTILPDAATLTIQAGATQLVATWTAPAETPPAGFTLAGYVGYATPDIDPKTVASSYQQVFFDTATDTLTFTITGLATGTLYRVWVAPYYTVTNGEGINAEAIGTLRDATGTPT